MEDLNTLVLAAGKGTRMAAVSAGKPKPLIQIAGETILGRNLRWLSRQGIRAVWINLHYKPEEVRRAIGSGSRFGVEIRYIHEPEILGTAGAVRNVASEWTDTFLVVYGDNLVHLDLQEFLALHRERKAVVSVALFDRKRQPHTGIAGGYVKLAQDGRIEEFHEGTPEARSPLVNAGVYLLEPEIVKEIPARQHCDFGRDLFPRLLSAGKSIYGYVISGYCLGIDTPESYQQAIRLIESGEVKLA